MTGVFDLPPGGKITGMTPGEMRIGMRCPRCKDPAEVAEPKNVDMIMVEDLKINAWQRRLSFRCPECTFVHTSDLRA